MTENTSTGRPQRSRAAARGSQRRQTDPDTFDARTRLSPDLRAIDGGISELDMEEEAADVMDNGSMNRFAAGGASGNAGGYTAVNAGGSAPASDNSVPGSAAPGGANNRNAGTGSMNSGGAPQNPERSSGASRGS